LTTLTSDAGSATAAVGASIAGAAGVGDCVGDWIDDGLGRGSGDLSSFAAGWAPDARPRLPKEKARRTGFKSVELAAATAGDATAGAAAAGAAAGASVRGCRPKSESPILGARVDRLPKLNARRMERLEDGAMPSVLDESSGGFTVGGGEAMGSAAAGGMAAAGAVAGGGEARGGGESAGRLIENGDAGGGDAGGGEPAGNVIEVEAGGAAATGGEAAGGEAAAGVVTTTGSAAAPSVSRSFEKVRRRAAPEGVLLTRLSAPSFFMPTTLCPLTASNVIPVMMPFCCACVPSTTSVTTMAPLA
jgi:hypothetical protein